MKLSKDGEEQLALALILLRDFKSGGSFDVEVVKMIHELAHHLDVFEEYEQLVSKVPLFKITNG